MARAAGGTEVRGIFALGPAAVPLVVVEEDDAAARVEACRFRLPLAGREGTREERGRVVSKREEEEDGRTAW